MGTGYVRQSAASIVAGLEVQAAPLNAEFNRLRDAFDGTSGHAHDGSTGNGPVLPISVISGVSAFARTYLDDTTAALTLTTLGVSAFVQTTFDDVDASAFRTTISAQTLDATLTSLAAYNTNGILTQTSADTFTGRTIAGTSGEITVTNGSGVAGNPTLSLPTAIVVTSHTFSGALLPTTSATYALGSSTFNWSGLFLKQNAVIDYNTLEYTITHDSANNRLSFSGGILSLSEFIGTGIKINSGGAINFNSGDVTITHSANALAFAGASNGYSFDQNILVPNGISIRNTGGTATITLGSGAGTGLSAAFGTAGFTASGSGAASITSTNGDIALGTTRNITITSDLDLTLSSGAASSLILNPLAGPVVLSKGQLQFPATQNPSAGANTLDDYEEGPFIPTIAGTTVAGAGTYTLQQGNYTKVGNAVTIVIFLTWTAHTGTGNTVIAGLPFVAASGTNPTVSPYCETLTFAGPVTGIIAAGTSTIILRTMATGAAAAALPIDTAASIGVTMTYLTTT